MTLESNWHSQPQQQSLCDDVSTSTRKLITGQSGIRDVRGNATDGQTGTRKLVRDSEPVVDEKPQFEIDLRVQGVSQDAILQDEEKMKDINKKLERLRIGSCTKSIRKDLSNGNMIFSEESSRAIYEMGNMELIELRQTSETIQCLSCLKQVPEGLNMCLCGVWPRPNQSTIDRIRAALAALKTPYNSTTVILSRGKNSGHNQWQMDHQKNHGCMKRGNETTRMHLKTRPMAERRNIPSFSIGARLD